MNICEGRSQSFNLLQSPVSWNCFENCTHLMGRGHLLIQFLLSWSMPYWNENNVEVLRVDLLGPKTAELNKRKDWSLFLALNPWTFSHESFGFPSEPSVLVLFNSFWGNLHCNFFLSRAPTFTGLVLHIMVLALLAL